MKAIIGALCALGVMGALAAPPNAVAQAQDQKPAAAGHAAHLAFKHEAIKHIAIKHVPIKHAAQNHSGGSGPAGAQASAGGASQGNAKDLTAPKAADSVPKYGGSGKQ
jgi:hypothetical protein